VPSLPLLNWLEWRNERERKAHAVKPRRLRAGTAAAAARKAR
jgi:hypothetical protein